MVAAPRPVSWLPYVMYGAVLLAGLHDQARGHGGIARAAALAAAVGALAALEPLQRRGGAPPAVLLAARTALCVLVAALDGSGLSNLLFLLVPFTAYFAYGRRVAVTLAVALVAVPAGWATIVEPRWYRDGEHLTDVLMLGVGMALAVAMASAAVGERDSRARLRLALAEVAELSAAAERGRVARDLHDSLGHHLTAVSIQLEKATAFRDLDAAAAEQAVRDARSAAARALDEVRGAVRTLAQPFSLSGALAELADGGGPCTVDVEVLGDERELPVAARVALFRAAQEGVTNARRHAGAARVTVRATIGDDAARLVVADDGHGFAEGATDGFGLRGMRERVAAVGGSVDVTGTSGVTLTVTVPRRAA
ncbi:sensor histidine kinase [Dactylosporangium aurantiacum]|uniref:histidine kinase n=1 Tax=Dactylosporangium aurantiacum TaxID=35754 RepID=A0A9Q9ILE8_9ACTN|nr:sensor histidine kinase [Dactylosporangium aurantiacum]MDG6103217.1 sensor histidine kinase [Dactylosporangium aurantiacum]UWZ57721.1 sensor histidine kinase [Dactylosporangium aurantiacum]